MIVNVRGSSGSGKSTIGHAFLNEFPHEELYEDGWNKVKPRHVGYQLPDGMRILGSYKSAGGGMDTLSPHDRSAHYPFITRHALESKHLFFEALVMSSTVPAYYQFVKDLIKIDIDQPVASLPVVFPFLDTPPELCIQRVYQRNGGKPIKEENIVTHHAYLQKVRKRMIGIGLDCPVVDHRVAYETIKGMLFDAGWRP